MKTYGIICEYNPFHNGHLLQIEDARKKGATHIVAVMSGNYVQRGDVAIVDKFKRAEIAVQNGVDLVIELPVMYSLSNAEMFARAGMLLLGSLGCVDAISFGSENGDIELLKTCAAAAIQISTEENLKPLLEQGMSYPAAVEKLVTEKFGPIYGTVFSSPNNILAVEYLKAMKVLGLDFEAVTLKREVSHDTDETTGNIASASYIRELIENDDESYAKYMPQNMADTIKEYEENETLAYFDNLERELLYLLRSKSSVEIAKIPDVGQGLENRIAGIGRDVSSVDDFLEKVDTKRYTIARMRRILLNMYLGITKEDLQMPPTFGRVLAFNEKGVELIKQANSQVDEEGKPTNKYMRPITPSLGEIANLKVPQMTRGIELACKSSDLYMLASREIRPCASDFSTKIEIQK